MVFGSYASHEAASVKFSSGDNPEEWREEKKDTKKVSPFIRELWKKTPFKNMSIIALNSVYKKFMRRALEEGVLPEKVKDAFDTVDPSDTYEELITNLASPEYIGIRYDSPEEYYAEASIPEVEIVIKELIDQAGWKKIAEAVAAEKTPKELADFFAKELGYRKLSDLEKAARKGEILEKRLKELGRELEWQKQRRELTQTEYDKRIKKLHEQEETLKKWSEELAKIQFGIGVQPAPKPESEPYMVKIRFMDDAPAVVASNMKVYGPFEAAEEYEVPADVATIFFSGGVAEPVEKVEEEVKPVPEKLPEAFGITKNVERRLKLRFRANLVEALGYFPRKYNVIFLAELDNWRDAYRTMSEEEAYRESLKALALVEKRVIEEVEKWRGVRVKAEASPTTPTLAWTLTGPKKPGKETLLAGMPVKKKIGYLKVDVRDPETLKYLGRKSLAVKVVPFLKWSPSDFKLASYSLDWNCYETEHAGMRLVRCVAQGRGVLGGTEWMERFLYLPKPRKYGLPGES